MVVRDVDDGTWSLDKYAICALQRALEPPRPPAVLAMACPACVRPPGAARALSHEKPHDGQLPFAPAHSDRTSVLDRCGCRAQARIMSSALVRMRAVGAAGQRGQLEWHTHTRPASSNIV